MEAAAQRLPSSAAAAPVLVPAILIGAAGSHLLNDFLQAVIPALYPLLKTSYDLNFTQVGLIAFVFQLTASILQPLVGIFTDKHPLPFSASMGMIASFAGLVLLALAPNYALLLLAAAMVGLGSAIFHPEAARMARAASGGRFGLAQSLFQVGGNVGSALGPLLAALIIVPRGQASAAWFVVLPLADMALLYWIGRWYAGYLARQKNMPRAKAVNAPPPSRTVVRAIAVLLALIFSKFFYMASLGAYFTFYLIDKFALTLDQAQYCLFAFLAAVAAGTFIGGPVGDRYGRRRVIWGSILGVLPLTLLLPYANLPLTIGLSMAVGFILSSAFPAIVVYAQELMPGRVGMVSGLFFGFAFGMGGLGAAVFGWIADVTSVDFVFRISAFLPAIGLLAYFLPRTGKDLAR